MCRKVGVEALIDGQVMDIETPEELWERLSKIQNSRDVMAGRKIEKVRLSQGERALELWISSRVIVGGIANGKKWGNCPISDLREGKKQICGSFIWS
ncbi:hypothetical protein KAW43_00795 [Candidatus Parcubacteria bacterium]|jgi:hypothetical protein|nr:hypothetical protein [Candidatus Parcubacteria bacterium]